MSLKSIIWKRTQNKRDTYENKYYRLFYTALNKEFRKLADKIDVTNYNSDSVLSHMDSKSIEKIFSELYRIVGVAFAKDVYKTLKAENMMFATKADDMPEDEWMHNMEAYVRTRAGNKIISIAEQNRLKAKQIIRGVLDESTSLGWGSDETARAIKKGLVTDGIDMNKWRALRIARTEIVSASNQGAFMGAKSLDMPMVKYWIATYDSRTRDTHMVMEAQNPKDIDEAFIVGGWPCESPGDPDLPPEEVINCRCVVAFGVKGM